MQAVLFLDCGRLSDSSDRTLLHLQHLFSLTGGRSFVECDCYGNVFPWKYLHWHPFAHNQRFMGCTTRYTLCQIRILSHGILVPSWCSWSPWYRYFEDQEQLRMGVPVSRKSKSEAWPTSSSALILWIYSAFHLAIFLAFFVFSWSKRQPDYLKMSLQSSSGKSIV
jgi:hypothetical protein